jgi:hypothetical protein
MASLYDLVGIEVEHLLGDRLGALVKIRAISNNVTLLGQVTPESARQIAAHLSEAAARAEYESDLYSELRRNKFDDETIASVFGMVRMGEMRRMTNVEKE